MTSAQEPETEISTRTDKVGRFVFQEAPVGTHELRVILPAVPDLGSLTLGREAWVEAG